MWRFYAREPLWVAEARLGGMRLVLTRRQMEILALLALNREGLSLGMLHSLLYGDAVAEKDHMARTDESPATVA